MPRHSRAKRLAARGAVALENFAPHTRALPRGSCIPLFFLLR